MTNKTKRRRALWTKAFPQQAAALSPEKALSGGVKARSGSFTVRMDVYNAINELFACANPYCGVCHKIPGFNHRLHFRDDTHHIRGKDGLLLFDVRWFISVCRKGHSWIDANRDEARKLGLLAKDGEFNKLKP